MREFLREGELQAIFTEHNFDDGHEVLKTSCLQQLHAPVKKDLKLLDEYRARYNYRGIKTKVGKQQRQESQEEGNITKEQQKDFRVQAGKKFPFLVYASQYLLFHANEAERLGTSKRNFIQSFPSARWIPIYNLFEEFRNRRYQGIETLILYILAAQGCSNLVQLLPAFCQDCVLRIEGEEFPSMLTCAIYTGHLHTAYAQVDLDPADLPRGITPLTRGDFKDNKDSRSLLRALVSLGDMQLLRKAVENNYCRGDRVHWDDINTEEMLDLLIGNSVLPDCCSKKQEQDTQEPSRLHADFPYINQAMDQVPGLFSKRIFDYKTMIEYAVSKNFLRLISIYLEHNGGGQDKIDNHLHAAVKEGSEDLMRDAVVRGANVNAQDEQGQTALQVAAKNSRVWPVRDTLLTLLFTQGAVDCSVRDHRGLTAMDLFFERDPRYCVHVCVAFFVRAGVHVQPLMECHLCKDHQIPFVVVLCLWNCDEKLWAVTVSNPLCNLDRCDNHGRTALSWCFAHRHGADFRLDFERLSRWEIGRGLLQSHRVDVNSRDDAGCTTLEHFIRHPRPPQSEGFKTFADAFFGYELLHPNLLTSNGESPLELIVSLYDTWPAEFGDVEYPWLV